MLGSLESPLAERNARLPLKLVLVDFAQSLLTRRILVTCRRCFPMLYQAVRKFAVTHFVEHVERIDQQAFMIWSLDR